VHEFYAEWSPASGRPYTEEGIYFARNVRPAFTVALVDIIVLLPLYNACYPDPFLSRRKTALVG